MGAVNRPEPALWITLAAIPLNALLAYAMINGAFGMPRLDLLGAGLATTAVNVAMCVAAVWVCYARRPFRKYRVLGRFWRPDGRLMAKIFVIGLPISGGFMLEWGLFSSAALLVGWIGTAALAAHQIALQVASLLFMVPFGISLAATVRVGHAVGRRDPAAIRRAGFGAMALGVVFMLATTLMVIALRDRIPFLFLGDGGTSAETAHLAATLLLVGATFFVTDGLQGIAAGALRGLERYPRADAVRSIQLLGDRLSRRIPAGVSRGPRHDRHLDRLFGRGRNLRHALGVALCAAEPPHRTAVGRLSAKLDGGTPSVPVPTLVSHRSTYVYKRRNPRDTNNSMILAWLWIRRSYEGLAAMLIGTSNPPH